MLLTKPQQLRFWREWSIACKVQGWTKAQSWTGAQIDNERHALLDRAGFDSLTKVDQLAGFDRVLAELAALSRPADITPQMRAAEQPKTRLRYAIAALGKQLSTAQLGDGSNAYIARISIDRFGTAALDNLSLHQLEQLRNTLAGRLSVHRRRARQSAAASVPENVPF
jgi:hypothetical protein